MNPPGQSSPAVSPSPALLRSGYAPAHHSRQAGLAVSNSLCLMSPYNRLGHATSRGLEAVAATARQASRRPGIWNGVRAIRI